MRRFKCKECDTIYSTSGEEVPPTPKWNDGHVCDLVPILGPPEPLGLD